MNWDEIWNSIATFFTEKGLYILGAIATLIIGYFVLKIVFSIIKKALSKSKMATITQGFLLSVIKVLMYVMLFVVVLQVLGIPMTGFATVLVTAGAAIALALKDSLSNIAYGLILISTKPFYQGDFVEIGGKEGTVKEIKIMSTQIITTDNKKVIIPNSTVYSSAIVNYSARGSRRMEMLFDISYKADVELAKKIMLDVCNSNGKIMLDPAPAVNLKYFKDSNITLFLTCWTKAPYWEIYFYLNDNIFNEFKRNNISIDYNQVEVRMLSDNTPAPYRKEALPKRVEVNTEVETKHFNIFDLDSFKDLQKGNKKARLKKLEAKQNRLEKKINKLKTNSSAPQIKQMIAENTLVIYKKLPLKKMQVSFKLKKEENNKKITQKSKKPKK